MSPQIVPSLFASVSQDVRTLKGTVDGLVSNLPKIVGEVVRSVWQEGGGKR